MQSTHDVRLDEDKVTKRFVSNDRGEADREWRALSLLATYAPGLAPDPVRFERQSDRPSIEMSRLPGKPLGATPLTADQIRAVVNALRTLHEAVPPDVLARLPHRISGAAEMVDDLRQQLAVDIEAPSAQVADALRHGTEWFRTAPAEDLESSQTLVFARADGNLANFVWDGRTCRIVDFEDSGSGDLAYEIADLVEHVSGSLTGALNADQLLETLALSSQERERVHNARRLFALFWLVMLLPGAPGQARNPPGSADRQAERLLSLLA